MKNETTALEKNIKTRIASLFDDESGGGGGDGEPQDGEDEGSPSGASSSKPSDGKPKAGEEWKTEKGGKVLLVVVVVGDKSYLANKDLTGVWDENGKPVFPDGETPKIFGCLIIKVGEGKGEGEGSGPGEPGEGESSSERLVEGVYGTGRGGEAYQPDPEIERAKVIFEGCYGRRRDGKVIGPFSRAKSEEGWNGEWEWKTKVDGEDEAYRSNGTFDAVFDREHPHDVLEVFSTNPEE